MILITGKNVRNNYILRNNNIVNIVAIYYCAEDKKEGIDTIFLTIVCMLAGILLSAALTENIVQKQRAKEYLRGNIKVEYHQVYSDSILIKTDTIIIK